MRFFLIIASSLNIVFSQIPETLMNQQNKSITNTQNEFTEIKKSNLSFLYGPKGDMKIFVNIDKKNRLISKTYYDSELLKDTYIIQENCKYIDCEYYIHKKNIK